MKDINQLDNYHLKNGKIYLCGVIDDEMAVDTIQKIQYLMDRRVETIKIFIHSPGGELDAESAIVDQMDRAKEEGIKVHTYGMGACHSGGASLLANGSDGYRFISKNGSVMLHPCSWGLEADHHANQQNIAGFLEEKNETFLRRLYKCCKNVKSYKRFLKDISNDLWLGAKEAIEYGIVDKYY